MMPISSSIDEYASDADSSLSVFHEVGQLSGDPETICYEDGEAVKKAFIEGMASRCKATVLQIIPVRSATDGVGWAPCSDSSAKIATFNIFRNVIANKCGGDANEQMAWFGGTKSQLSRILSVGFCGPTIAAGGFQFGHGVGVYLSPLKYPTDYVGSSTPDEDGIRYMLLCRVVLGNTETISPGSTQSFPSSDEFHSGVDNRLNPRRYVIWCCNMNKHILPEYLLRFRLSSSTGIMKRPSSPFVTFGNLLSMLENVLDSREMALISKSYNEFKNRKLPRCHLIRKIRQIAGDGLLKSIIGSCYSNLNSAFREQRIGA